MTKLFDIKGKKIIFTGASRGLGKGMTEILLEAGAEVAMIGVTDRVFETAEAFSKEGYVTHAVQGNLGNKAEVARCFNEAFEKLGGRIDVLFNAAGIQRRHKSEEFPIADWDAVLDINLTAPFLLCQMAAKEMIKQGEGGKIINVASMLSFFGGYTVPAYAASKGGIAQITKAFCNEWAKYGINVNAIAPGYMDTEMNENLLNDTTRNMEILNRIPAGRWGTAADMQGITLFLASHASDYLNGAIIPVDGGYLVR